MISLGMSLACLAVGSALGWRFTALAILPVAVLLGLGILLADGANMAALGRIGVSFVSLQLGFLGGAQLRLLLHSRKKPPLLPSRAERLAVSDGGVNVENRLLVASMNKARVQSLDLVAGDHESESRLEPQYEGAVSKRENLRPRRMSSKEF